MKAPYHGTGVYTPGKIIGPSTWTYHDVIVAMEGRVRLNAGGGEFFLEEGDALVIPPHNPFEGEALTPVAIIWVLHFSDYEAASPRSPFHYETHPFQIPGACRNRRERDLLKELSLAWNESEGRNRRSVSLLAELIVARMEEAHFSPRKLESPRMRAAIEAGKGCMDDPVGKMAKAAGLGPSRFRQAFREAYGTSPAEHLLKLRIDEARRLLTTTPEPIKEISQKVGYGELAAFHRAFKKVTQSTPAAYRKRFGTAA